MAREPRSGFFTIRQVALRRAASLVALSIVCLVLVAVPAHAATCNLTGGTLTIDVGMLGNSSIVVNAGDIEVGNDDGTCFTAAPTTTNVTAIQVNGADRSGARTRGPGSFGLLFSRHFRVIL